MLLHLQCSVGIVFPFKVHCVQAYSQLSWLRALDVSCIFSLLGFPAEFQIISSCTGWLMYLNCLVYKVKLVTSAAELL